MTENTTQPGPHDSPPGTDGIAQFYGWDRLPADVEESKARLRKEYPAWSIIYTRPNGKWWALRYPEYDPTKRISNRVSEVEADTAEELRAELAKLARVAR